MNYWQRWIGDWKRKTTLLSLEAKGAYGELLDYLYANDTPSLPLEKELIYRAAGAHSASERRAVDVVLTQFFSCDAAGYHQSRTAEEIARHQAYVEGQREYGRRRWQKHPATENPKGNGEDKINPLELGPVITAIPLADGSEYEVHQGLVDEFTKLYPAVEPLQTLNEIRAWNLAHANKRKTRRGIIAHLNNWFQRDQNSP